MSIEDLQNRLDAARGAGDTDSRDEIEDNEDLETEDLGDDNDTADSDDGDSGESEGKDDDAEEKHDRLSTLDKIKSIFSRKKEDSTDDSTDDDGDDNTDQKDGESEDDADTGDHDDDTGSGEQKFVDPKFVYTARRYGWTDDQIVAYANENSVLDVVQLGVAMEEAIGNGEAVDAEDGDDDLISDEVLAKLSEEEENQPIIDQVVKPLLAQVKELRNSLKGVQTDQQGMNAEKQNKELKRDYDRANNVFDSHAKEYGILGSTEKLKRLSDGTLDVRDPAVKVRREVFSRAMSMRKVNPSVSMDEAMEDAMFWFRGKYGQDQMEKNLLKKIKTTSKKVSPKTRSQHRTTNFANDRERRASIVLEAKERSNRKRS